MGKLSKLARGVRRVCFVTGTRAEFGLMASVLRAIQSHLKLKLQIVATGMHLDRAHGKSIDVIRKEGWTIDETVPWKPGDQTQLAQSTGQAISRLAQAYDKLQSDIVLVVGDRVEAFAAASAAHIAGRVVAHVHGGDRALGQIDDSLRHAITKLAHIHFPATRQSAGRIAKLGEDRWRIHLVGSPGIDGIHASADPQALFGLEQDDFALVVLHPTAADDDAEQQRAAMLLKMLRGLECVVVVYPNNDPGAAGIIRCWEDAQGTVPHILFLRNVPRHAFLALLRDASILIGNSSAGVIEAASFGTPVLNIGDRQRGREVNADVFSVPWNQRRIAGGIKRLLSVDRLSKRNIYGRGDTGVRIARVLADVEIDQRMLRKLIVY